MQCLSCAYYKRAISKPCARSALDCGSCLPGFEEEPLTHNKRHYCGAIALQASSSPHTNISGAALSMYVVVGTAAVCGLILGIVGFIWCKRKRTGATSVQDSESQQVREPVCNIRPPPYEEVGRGVGVPLLEISSQQPPQVTAKNVTESTFSLNIQGQCEQSSCQANPFRQAQEPYDSKQLSFADGQEPSNELSDEESQPSPNAPDLNDEETMPSNWTYHAETPADTTDSAEAAEDFNDSGLSMPSSYNTSTASLAQQLMVPDAETFVLALNTFAGCIDPPSEDVLGARKRQCSLEREKNSDGPAKRVRGNSINSIDSEDEYQPESSLDHVVP